MRDRLLRLRHDAVVGGDDQHRDVGDLRTAGAHGRERLVAGGVEEGDASAAHRRLIGPDVLRDAARLGLHDGGLADRIEERRLTVVDVTHDRHDRWSRDEVGLVVLVLGRLELLLGRVLDRHLALDLGRDQLDLLVGERLGRGSHLAERHEDLDQLGHRDAERGGQVLDGRARLDDGRPGRRSNGLLLARRPDSGAVAGLAPLAATSAAALDDHAPLASCGASARTNRAVWPLASVSHQRSILGSILDCGERRSPATRLRRALPSSSDSSSGATTSSSSTATTPSPLPGSGSVPTSAW